MGAKTALLAFAEGHIGPALAGTHSEQAEAEELVRQVLPGYSVAPVGEGTLMDWVYPPDDITCATVLAGAALLMTTLVLSVAVRVRNVSMKSLWSAGWPSYQHAGRLMDWAVRWATNVSVRSDRTDFSAWGCHLFERGDRDVPTLGCRVCCSDVDCRQRSVFVFVSQMDEVGRLTWAVIAQQPPDPEVFDHPREDRLMILGPLPVVRGIGQSQFLGRGVP